LTATATAGGLFLVQQSSAATQSKNRNFSFNKTLFAEEAVSATTTTTTTKKPYLGSPPEVDDTHRYILTDNPLNKIFEDGSSVKNVRELDITLYQYQVCPFCCKVRAFLDYNKIPYKIVEVNPMLKTEVKFSKDYKKVPIVIVNGIQINDSSVIISALNELLQKENNAGPVVAGANASEVKWRKWVDHKLLHTLPPNIYRNPQEALDAFEYISTMNNFSWHQKMFAKYAGGMVMWGISKKLKDKYGIEDERDAIFTCANEWVEELNGKPFHGGDRADLADLATYGALSSIEGLLTFTDMTQATKIGQWYFRMKKAVGECSGKR